MRVRFRKEAADDVLSARAWYDDQRDGLGDEFVGSLERVVELSRIYPTLFQRLRQGIGVLCWVAFLTHSTTESKATFSI